MANLHIVFSLKKNSKAKLAAKKFNRLVNFVALAFSLAMEFHCVQSWGKFWSSSVSIVPPTVTTAVNPCTVVPAPVSWAKTQTGGNNINQFNAVAADCLGNIYAAGTINSNLTYDFGAGISLTGNVVGAWKTAVLVKYDRTGNAVWARKVTNATSEAEWRGVAVDPAGNVYVVGTIYSNVTFDFGNGFTLAPTLGSNNHVAIAKYSSSGVTLWAQTTTTFLANAYYNAVAVDKNGNSYVAARINGAFSYDYGNLVTTPNGISTAGNWAVVKYNTDGVAQWANIAVAPSAGDFSFPNGITVDNNGSVFACGVINQTGIYNFSTGAAVQGNYTGQNAAIAKFSATSGAALLTRTTQATSLSVSVFNACSADASGNVVAVGFQATNAANNWGNSLTTTGVSGAGSNAIAIKYDNNLNSIWARTSITGSTPTQFKAVATDSTGNFIAAGFQEGTTAIGYGGSITATAVSGFAGAGGNALVVKYDSAGTATQAKVVTTGAAISSFAGIAVADADTLVAVGLMTNNGSYTFDPGLTIAGTYAAGNNMAIIKYPK